MVVEMIKLFLSPENFAWWEYAERIHVDISCDDQILDLGTGQSRKSENLTPQRIKRGIPCREMDNLESWLLLTLHL